MVGGGETPMTEKELREIYLEEKREWDRKRLEYALERTKRKLKALEAHATPRVLNGFPKN